jgi:putative polyhydroxyalkanoate system protein
MPKFDLEIPHNLALPEVHSRLEKAKGKLETAYGATCTWEGEDRLLVTRKGLQATVHLEPTRLHIDVELGLLLTPLAGSIRTGITRQLTELLTQPEASAPA